jgi:hypothetical protein
MDDGRTKLWYLKNIDLFRHLNDEEIRRIEQHTLMREIKKGEALYFEGSSDQNIYLIVAKKLYEKGRWVCWKAFTAAPLNVLLLRFQAYPRGHLR